ncbi:hypothetical protein J6590_016609 [Homalodisca vitripennis]|nr:hypothetical protein J6590_016609 [Homalodisca vitripennis]
MKAPVLIRNFAAKVCTSTAAVKHISPRSPAGVNDLQSPQRRKTPHFSAKVFQDSEPIVVSVPTSTIGASEDKRCTWDSGLATRATVHLARERNIASSAGTLRGSAGHCGLCRNLSSTPAVHRSAPTPLSLPRRPYPLALPLFAAP